MNEVMTQELIFEGSKVKIHLDESGNPWWEASNICEIIGIENHSDAVSRLDDDEKGIVFSDTLGGAQKKLSVNESGLYTLIMRSNKPQAAPFRRWVTKEVLPTIRKTGSYAVKPMSQLDMIIASAQALQEQERRMSSVEIKVEQVAQKAQDQISEVSQRVDAKYEQLQSQLKIEKVNQFPQGCETLEWIRTNIFQDSVTTQNISAFLHHIAHSVSVYKYTDEKGKLYAKEVFQIEGLKEARNRLVRESALKKQTQQNYIYIHPKIGRFYIKKISHVSSFAQEVSH